MHIHIYIIRFVLFYTYKGKIVPTELQLNKYVYNRIKEKAILVSTCRLSVHSHPCAVVIIHVYVSRNSMLPSRSGAIVNLMFGSTLLMCVVNHVVFMDPHECIIDISVPE